MKKIIVILLSIVLIICNSMVVCAETITNGITGDTNHSVTGVFTKASDTYDVTITWGALTYKYAGSLTWNGTTYDASVLDGGGYNTTWSVVGTAGTDDIITVTNGSDKTVDATFAFAENGENLSVDNSTLKATYKVDATGTATDTGSMQLGSTAVAGSQSTTRKMQVGISGHPMGILPIVGGSQVDLTTTGIKIGTVTVTLTGN